MEVSQGFARKISTWLTKELVYKPFETNDNPYKANIMLVNSIAGPAVTVDEEDTLFLINAFANEDFMDDLLATVETLPKEYKGAKKFVKWLRDETNAAVVMAPINAYMTDSTAELKALQKVDKVSFTYGQQVFDEVLHEFTNVDVIVLHGTYAFEQFTKRYADTLTIRNTEDTTIKAIEQAGQYATMTVGHREIAVYVSRSLSTFTTNNAAFEALRNHMRNVQNTNIVL